MKAIQIFTIEFTNFYINLILIESQKGIFLAHACFLIFDHILLIG